MPTPADVPLAHDRSPPGLAAPLAGAVADDLQAIFPDAPPRPNGARTALGVSRDARRARRSQNRIAALGAIAAAALAGLSAGALIGRHPSPAASAPPRADRVPILLASQPQAQQPPVKAASSIPPRPAEPKGLPGPGPLAPPQLVYTANNARTAAAVVKVKGDNSGKLRARRVARSRTSSSPSYGPGYAPAPVPASASRCRDDCDYEDVLNADARLRRAYASAADAGVSRPVLVSYRNEWSGLRKRAPSSPDHVVSRYYEMAHDLERYADKPKAGRSSSPRSHALAGLRADLASLLP